VACTAFVISIMPAADAINAGMGPKSFLLARMVFLVLLCAWFLRRNGERWADLGLRRPGRWWMVPLLVAGGFLLFIMVSMFMMHLLLPAVGAQLPEAHATPRADLGEYLFWAIPVSWGSAAFGEELLFRGFILNRIGQVIGSSRTPVILVAVALQAAIFGSLHIYQGIGGMLMAGAAGLVIGLMWLVGGRNLWPCFLLHGLIDFLAMNGL
jgi:hypothetical protein